MRAVVPDIEVVDDRGPGSFWCGGCMSSALVVVNVEVVGEICATMAERWTVQGTSQRGQRLTRSNTASFGYNELASSPSLVSKGQPGLGFARCPTAPAPALV